MLYHRLGKPEEEEIVLCKVTKLFPNSIFVDLLEYNDSGMVHISEIAPGRIRNLRDYVSIGRQIVCKVLKIDRERGHIDLSLRRVNSTQRQEKLEELKQELKAETLVKSVSKRLNKPLQDVYNTMIKKLFPEYSHLYLCFRDVATGDADLLKMGVESEIAKVLTETIKDKFKPPKITIEGEIKIHSYLPNGIEYIKEALNKVEQVSPNLSLRYLGGGRFKLVIEEYEYKVAEKYLSKVQEILEQFNKDKLSNAVFEREKKE